MILLHLLNILPGRPVVLGPAPWFEISGNFIRQGPDGEIVAEYIKHSWHARGQYFTSITCRERTLVHFEDAGRGATPDKGPFDHIRLADGALHANGEILAKFVEETQLWHSYPTETYFPIMIIKPAAETG
jgi:hypothetical protein